MPADHEDYEAAVFFQPFIVSILLLQLSEIFFGKYQNQSMTVKPKKWIWANIDTRMLPLAQNRRDLPPLIDQTHQTQSRYQTKKSIILC